MIFTMRMSIWQCRFIAGVTLCQENINSESLVNMRPLPNIELIEGRLVHDGIEFKRTQR